jgi:pimeloyl-ACP methyl ester carboxylesterase
MKSFIFWLGMALGFTVNVAAKSELPTSQMIQVNKINYHLLTKGDPKNPLIIFLHGFPENAMAWSKQLDYFEQTHYAVAIDLKGYGLSDKPLEVGEYSVEKVAADIIAIAKKLSKKPAVVVGHDWGGAVAWTIAKDFQKNVKKLVIINGAHPIQFFREYHYNEAQFQASDYIRKIQSKEWTFDHYSKNNFEDLRKTLFLNPIGEASDFFDCEMQEQYLSVWRNKEGFDASLKYYLAMTIPNKALFAGDVASSPFFLGYHIDKTPTLVLWGSKDIYLLEGVNRGLDKFVKNLTLVEFPENSHWIVHEAPDLISDQIAKFIQ